MLFETWLSQAKPTCSPSFPFCGFPSCPLLTLNLGSTRRIELPHRTERPDSDPRLAHGDSEVGGDLPHRAVLIQARERGEVPLIARDGRGTEGWALGLWF